VYAVRVNARLDAESERQLKFLVEETGAGVSDALKASIAHYYESLRAKRAPGVSKFRALIGQQGSGRSDVATRTKELFAAGVAEKAGFSVHEPAPHTIYTNRRKP
jgi:hypothetical protein